MQLNELMTVLFFFTDGSLMFGFFPDLSYLCFFFSPKLSMIDRNFVNYTFMSRTETSSKIQKLSILSWKQLFCFCISTCSCCIRTQLEAWLYYQGFDCNVIFENNTHKTKYDQPTLRN